MDAIKIGNERVLLNNVTNVNERVSNCLRALDDGTVVEDYYAKDEERQKGLVVTVYFVTGLSEGDYVKFCGKEAEEFLKRFDALTIQQVR